MREYKADNRKEFQITGLAGEEQTKSETLLGNFIKRCKESGSKIEQEMADKKQLQKTEKQLLQKICYETIKGNKKLQGNGVWWSTKRVEIKNK